MIFGVSVAEQSITSTFANVELQGPVGPALALGPAAGSTRGVTASAGHDPAVPRHVPVCTIPPPASPGTAGGRRWLWLRIQGWMKQLPGFESPALNHWALHKCHLLPGLPAQERCRSTQGDWDALGIQIQQGGKAVGSTRTPAGCEEGTRGSHVVTSQPWQGLGISPFLLQLPSAAGMASSACTSSSELLTSGPADSQGIITGKGPPWSLRAPRDFGKGTGFLAPVESLSMLSGALGKPLVVQALDQGDHQESNKELLTHIWAKPAFLLSPLS